MSSINGINEIRPPQVVQLKKTQKDNKSFQSELMKLINKVDKIQKEADEKAIDVIKGKDVSVHEVMVAMERANLSISMLIEMRNKLIDAYKELTHLR